MRCISAVSTSNGSRPPIRLRRAQGCTEFSRFNRHESDMVPVEIEVAAGGANSTRKMSMRALVFAGSAAILMTAASLAFGQPAPAPAPGAEDSKQGGSAGVRDKQRACRQEGQGKGTRGPDLQDYVAVCVAEARL